MKIDLKEIQKKKDTLEKCKIYLKQEFVGIDEIIDSLLDYIQVWYLMPDILSRPVIVNLWGMTGVGKTDLVRKMVKFLSFQDRFVEIELSNTDQSSWHKNIFSVLDSFRMNDEEPGIVLFDEIQRFNTVTDDGGSIPQSKFKDFWELLSDGKLSRKSRYNFDSYLFKMINKQKEKERAERKGEKYEEENDYLGAWEANELKQELGLDMGLEQLADLRNEDVLNLINQSIADKRIYEPVDHRKTLLIISGNLDEAFQMAIRTSEADIDADIFHAFTKKISFVDIKNALSRKFRPEQVARFGNIHLIYRALKRADFEKLIEKEVERVISQTKEKIGIDLEIDESMNQLIYRNGVFPVQGVRPVFSSVIDILETNLSNYLFTAIMNKKKKIALKYDDENKYIQAKIGKDITKTPYVGRIDKIRNRSEIDNIANISVHEAGHVIAYICLIGLVPLQVKSKISSSYASGFTFPHMIHETKENIVKKIKIYLAGGIAEEVVFGEENASIGRENDREMVTRLTVNYVRKYGFDDEFQSNYTIEDYPYTLNKNQTDLDIEKMIARLVAETKELMIQNKVLLIAMSERLRDQGNLQAEDMIAISKQHGIDVEQREEGYLYISDYNDQLENEL